jgi:hypothetical protein
MHATRSRRWPRLAAASAIVALVAACGGGASTSGPGATTAATGPGGGGQATGAPVTDLTKLCDLLGPGDFAAVGINGAAAPTVNSDGPGSAYCVYAGQSAATGGIEFDVFVDEDAEGVFDTIVAESSGELTPATIPGVDEALGTDGVAGQADGYGTVVVRKGPLVFTIAAPGGPGTALKLSGLAAVVIARAAGLL